MTRDVDTYHHFIETIFTDYEIPFFIDEKRPMLHHPLIELIRSAFDTITGNWGYEPLFRAVKTDFFTPLDSFEQLDDMRIAFDQLENFVLKLGLHGHRWKNESFWIELHKKDIERSKNQAFFERDVSIT